MAHGTDRALLEGALRQATDTRAVTVAQDALAMMGRVFEECFGDRAAVVVADETTFAIAGRSVDQALRASPRVVAEPFIFSLRPPLHADFTRMLELQAALSRHEAVPVAVGSGTVNDLTKLAAHRLGRPYMAVATAASMDGYAAFGAAITHQGFKQTMQCAAPRAVLADLDILTTAPPALTASGYGDLLGKITAGADWLVADTLEVEPIDTGIWSMVQPPVRGAISEPGRLLAGDRQVMESFFLGLIMSGLAMQAAQNSRPASGSEHQFSHLWEMNGLTHDGEQVSHGFKVGVGTVVMAALYERVLERDLSALDVPEICAEWPSPAELEAAVRASQANSTLADNAVTESRAKHPTPEQLRRRLELLRDRWPTLRHRLREQLLPAAELRRLLDAAGAPSTPAEIGLTLSQARASYTASRQIRRRYTVLDLAAETGLLTACVEELFGTHGVWPQTQERGPQSS
jgi:glycerol-1-phosphate dehydrogenase [NAD(P)+]